MGSHTQDLLDVLGKGTIIHIQQLLQGS